MLTRGLRTFAEHVAVCLPLRFKIQTQSEIGIKSAPTTDAIFLDP